MNKKLKQIVLFKTIGEKMSKAIKANKGSLEVTKEILIAKGYLIELMKITLQSDK